MPRDGRRQTGHTRRAGRPRLAAGTAAPLVGLLAALLLVPLPGASAAEVGAAGRADAEAGTGTGTGTGVGVGIGTGTGAGTPQARFEAPGNLEAVDRTLARIARRGAHETGFVEQRFLRFLDAPVESSGRLSYRPPDRLERITDKPKAESMVLDGDTLSMTRDGKTRSLSVSQLPAVGALVGSIRDLLAGNRSALEKRYRAIAQGDDENWQLVLLPSDAELATLVTRIVVAGQADRIATIEIQQADGDRSLMTLRPA